jgi:VCBS repeat-containing protein
VDVDNPPNTFTAVNSPAPSSGGYGNYTITAAGAWTYTLDNTNTTVQALNGGETLTDSFTVATIDGTTQVVRITITGSNDAAVISGTATGSVIEAGGVANALTGTPTAIGLLTDADPDNTSNTFTAVTSPTASAGGFGTFTVTASGAWNYTLDNSNSTVQGLNVGGTLTDTFIVTTIDGTPQLVTITINGTNDAAIVFGTTTGSVIEAGGSSPGTPIATGALADTDVDNPANTFTAVTSPAASDGGYGTFTMTAAGVWTYTLDNNNFVVDALNVGDTLTDSFTITSIDGTPQEVTITIHGSSDADPNDFDYLAAGSAVVSDPPFVYGTPGSDTVAGGGDVTQIVYGGAGADTLNGTGVNDIIYGGSGNDTIKGNNGDDVIYGGSGNDTINGSNGNDKIIGGFGADALTGGNGNDIFVYLSATDSRAGQFDTVSDFISGSDKIDLTAMGALGFVILALNSTSTSVPAHTIAWIYDSSANETIVYVNSTDHTLDIGDSSLLEIHLQGIATIEASDFILDAPVAPVVAAGDVVDPTVTTQSDGTIGTTTLSASSDLTGGTGTIVSDGSSILPAAGASFTVDAHNSQSRSVDHSTSSSDEPEPQSALLERTDAPTPVEFKSTLEQRGVADSNHAGAIGTGGMATEDRAMLNFAFALDASQIGANPHANASTVGNAHSHASEAIALSPGLVEVLENGNHGHSMAAEAHANSSNALLHGPSPLDAELFPAAHGASSSQDPGARGLGDSFHFKGLDMALERTLPASTPNDPVAPLHGHEHAAGANRFDAAPTNEDSLPGDGTHPMGGTVHSHVSHDLIV